MADISAVEVPVKLIQDKTDIVVSVDAGEMSLSFVFTENMIQQHLVEKRTGQVIFTKQTRYTSVVSALILMMLKDGKSPW